MNLGMSHLFKVILFFLLIQNVFANVKNIEFDLIKKGVEDNNTLLIIGGIQGDEPGGFMAASLITTHYTITKGSVWVVPNLNFYSIIKRGRGYFGDMNRKFATIKPNDPDYTEVQRVKEYISHENVKVVLNLHDGSGFYRKEHIDKLHSPYRWGQSTIIDQAMLDIPKYGNLEEIASKVCEGVNKNLIDEEHIYNVRNTQTKDGNKEMAKTLTYYAINQGKAAFGNEASKEFPVYKRAYYHILALEEYMKIMGIEFKRNFELTLTGVKDALYGDINISFYDDKIKLPLETVRPKLNFFPIKKDGEISFIPSNPLMTVVKNEKEYAIHYGNVKLVQLHPDYLEIDNVHEIIKLEVDGVIKSVNFGDTVIVENSFIVRSEKDFRVNVIGYTNKKYKNEANIKINKNSIARYYSVDKKGKIYRVEFYKDEKFAGMILVKFDNNLAVANHKAKQKEETLLN